MSAAPAADRASTVGGEHVRSDGLAKAAAKERYEFERKGYYFVDPKDSKDGAPVFNLVVPLRDTRGEGGG